MGSHRRKWGWWLVAAIAVALAASLLFFRNPVAPSEAPDASALDSLAEAPDAAPVVRDTVYVNVDGESVPVVRERKVVAGKPSGEAPAAASSSEAAPTSSSAPAAVETVVSIPVSEITGLIRQKSGRDVSLTTKAPDRITVSYSGKVNVPMLGEQNLDVSAKFKVIEVKGDRLVLQLDSGTAMNLAADVVAPLILERLPAGLVDSFSDGRAVVNLSAIPQVKKRLSGLTLTGVSVDDSNIKLSVTK